ncbi:MAG: serine protease [Caulobacter sp.]|nr:serine protease [Caulobacter sp.]
MRRAMLGLGLAVILAGVAHAGERYAVTPSGRPDELFPGDSVETVQAKISNTCMDRGWSVVPSPAGQVTCEAPMGFWRGLVNAGSLADGSLTRPREFVRFAIIQVGSGSRVQSTAWLDTPQGFGQIVQTPYTDDVTYNNLMNFLTVAGGQFPVGTSFPNHAYMGIVFKPEVTGAKGKQRLILHIGSVTPGTPAADAGVQAGDILLLISGKPIKDSNEYLKRLSSVTMGSTFDIVVSRNGANVALKILARTRPSITETPVAPPH